jgi:hypothetical protein
LKKSDSIFDILPMMLCLNHLKTPSASFAKGPSLHLDEKTPTEKKINL